MRCLLNLAQKNNCFETKKTSFLLVFFCFWGQKLQCGLILYIDIILNLFAVNPFVFSAKYFTFVPIILPL